MVDDGERIHFRCLRADQKIDCSLLNQVDNSFSNDIDATFELNNQNQSMDLSFWAQLFWWEGESDLSDTQVDNPWCSTHSSATEVVWEICRIWASEHANTWIRNQRHGQRLNYLANLFSCWLARWRNYCQELTLWITANSSQKFLPFCWVGFCHFSSVLRGMNDAHAFLPILVQQTSCQ